MMKLQNLNELRYIVELSHPNVEPSHIHYYVDSWPNPELAHLHAFEVYDSVYYSTVKTNAMTFTSFIKAHTRADELRGFSKGWEGKIIAVSAKAFFKARLKG